MADGPCKNPNCKSFGKSHPNCLCYSGMAKGGEAKNFCSEDRMHDKGCKYFAEGGQAELKSGDIVPNDAPDDELKSGYIIPADAPDDEPSKSELKSGDIVPAHEPDDNPYETPNQKSIATAEGFGRGFLGPLEAVAAKAGQYFPAESLVPLGQKQFGFTPEDIKAREEANPGAAAAGEAAGLVTGALSGTGLVGAAGKIGGAAHFAELSKLGSGIISNAIANGSIQMGDEAGDWLLGKGNQEDAVASSLTNIGAAGLLGGLGGAASGIGDKILGSLGGNKFLGKLEGTLAGFGAGAKSTYDAAAVTSAEKAGLFSHYDPSFGDVQKYYDIAKKTFQTLFSPHIASTAAAIHGYEEGGLEKAIINMATVEAAGVGIKGLSKYALVPAITKAMESGSFAGLGDAIQHTINVVNGNKIIDKAVDGILKGGTTPAIDWFRSEEERRKKRDELNSHIEQGGINKDIEQMQNPFGYPENYADGGVVKNAAPTAPLVGLAQQNPTQAALMGMAKSRVSNYLNNLRPVSQSIGPIFDSPPDQTQQKKSYNKALDIANRPLSILNDVQKGTLDPDQVKHFQNMYPEVNQLLQKKLTVKMIEGKMQDKKPSYRIRQGLSLLLGTPLSSEMAPQNIIAAQATFIPKQTAPEGGTPKMKKSTNSLSKISTSYSTANQARIKEKQEGD